MSRIYGRIFQIAYVVPDLDEAVEHWTKSMGVGPFYDFPIPPSRNFPSPTARRRWTNRSSEASRSATAATR
ncbi:hypothetical protein ACFSLT_22255 [Novosphingobium resinovorum]